MPQDSCGFWLHYFFSLFKYASKTLSLLKTAKEIENWSIRTDTGAGNGPLGKKLFFRYG